MRNYHIQNRNSYQEKAYGKQEILVEQQLSTWGNICPFTIKYKRPPYMVGLYIHPTNNQQQWGMKTRETLLANVIHCAFEGLCFVGWENATEITLTILGKGADTPQICISQNQYGNRHNTHSQQLKRQQGKYILMHTHMCTSKSVCTQLCKCFTLRKIGPSYGGYSKKHSHLS